MWGRHAAGDSDKLKPAEKDNERWCLIRKVGGAYGTSSYNPHF